MVEFKKGDRVLVSGEIGIRRNGLGVIEDVGSNVLTGVRLDTGKYVAAQIRNVTHYKEIVEMFKVGDKLVVVGARGHSIDVGSEVTVVEVFCNLPRNSNYRVEDERGLRQWVYNDDLRPISPPQKITKNGYEYELVGPVKPEWLVDGAWVVDKETGRKYRVSCDNGVYTFNNGAREVIVDFISLPTRFRPHEPKDWKWGDWAIYDGKRVFVIRPEHGTGHTMISGECFLNGLKYVPFSDLTPTF